jgi:hypothetical protein
MLPSASRLYLLSVAVLWLVGALSILVALTGRATGWLTNFRSWTRVHDIALVIACLLVAAVAWSFRRHFEGFLGRSTTWLGILGGLATATFLALIFLTGASDMLYMLSQGVIGLWVIAFCILNPVLLASGTRAVGYIAGTGLVLIATGFVMIALALGPALVTLIDAHSVVVNPADAASPLNSTGHLVLKAGSILGLPTLPVWAWLVSRGVRANTSLERTRER